MRPDIQKAFEFIVTQLSTLRLTKADHVLVERVVRTATTLIKPEEKDKKENKKEEKPLTGKN